MPNAFGARGVRADKTSDLVERYLKTLRSANRRPVSADVLMQALKLDALDWRLEHSLTGPSPSPNEATPAQLTTGRDHESVG